MKKKQPPSDSFSRLRSGLWTPNGIPPKPDDAVCSRCGGVKRGRYSPKVQGTRYGMPGYPCCCGGGGGGGGGLCCYQDDSCEDDISYERCIGRGGEYYPYNVTCEEFGDYLCDRSSDCCASFCNEGTCPDYLVAQLSGFDSPGCADGLYVLVNTGACYWERGAQGGDGSMLFIISPRDYPFANVGGILTIWNQYGDGAIYSIDGYGTIIDCNTLKGAMTYEYGADEPPGWNGTITIL